MEGMYMLAAFEVATTMQDIQALFVGCAFRDVQSITDNTTFDDNEIDYHQTMVCTFIENVEIILTETNGLVDVIRLNVSDSEDFDTPTHDIDTDGISVVPK